MKCESISWSRYQSHIRGEGASSKWRRPGLVSCDLKFLLISALKWALCALILLRRVVEPSQMVPHGFPYSLPWIAHRGMNPVCSPPAGDHSQILPSSTTPQEKGLGCNGNSSFSWKEQCCPLGLAQPLLWVWLITVPDDLTVISCPLFNFWVTQGSESRTPRNFVKGT